MGPLLCASLAALWSCLRDMFEAPLFSFSFYTFPSTLAGFVYNKQLALLSLPPLAIAQETQWKLFSSSSPVASLATACARLYNVPPQLQIIDHVYDLTEVVHLGETRTNHWAGHPLTLSLELEKPTASSSQERKPCQFLGWSPFGERSVESLLSRPKPRQKMHMHMHMHMNMLMHAHMHMHKHMQRQMQMQIQMLKHLSLHLHLSIAFAHVHAYEHAYACSYACTYAYAKI